MLALVGIAAKFRNGATTSSTAASSTSSRRNTAGTRPIRCRYGSRTSPSSLTPCAGYVPIHQRRCSAPRSKVSDWPPDAGLLLRFSVAGARVVARPRYSTKLKAYLEVIDPAGPQRDPHHRARSPGFVPRSKHCSTLMCADEPAGQPLRPRHVPVAVSLVHIHLRAGGVRILHDVADAKQRVQPARAVRHPTVRRTCSTCPDDRC